MEESGNAEERVAVSDSARKGRIDLTQFEKIPKRMEIEWHEHPIYGERYLVQISEPETPWVVGAVVPDFTPYDDYAKDKAEQEKMAKLFAMTPALIAELKKCYEIIDIYQSTGEDFNTQLAFHEKDLCEYLKHPCGPCEGDEGYYDDPLELSPELQAFYERGPSPRRTTEKQMEEAQRKREYGHSRPSVDDYDPVYDDPNYDEGPWE